MTYQDKVKASKEVLTAIQAMGDGEVIEFVYGINEHWKTKEITPKVYELRCRVNKRGEFSHSISDPDSSSVSLMNVESISKTSIKLYSYNMMLQKNVYTIPLHQMEIGIAYREYAQG
jgi:hypothetical protein